MRKLLLITFSALLFLLLTGCKSVKYVPVESVKHDSTYVYRVRHDSVYRRDSIYVLMKGDTVYKYRDRYLYRDRRSTDTLYVNKTDTIRIPYPVDVVRKLTWWERVKSGLAVGLVCFTLLVIVCFVKRHS
jgi:hypothetical protein